VRRSMGGSAAAAHGPGAKSFFSQESKRVGRHSNYSM
jgi:hypothetical protein